MIGFGILHRPPDQRKCGNDKAPPPLSQVTKKDLEKFVTALLLVWIVGVWLEKRRGQRNAALPPRSGQLLICLFVPPDRQADRLGDFEEQFNTVWLPRFGPRMARFIYMTHALRSAAAIIRITAIATVADRVMRAFGW